MVLSLIEKFGVSIERKIVFLVIETIITKLKRKSFGIYLEWISQLGSSLFSVFPV
jgi:hypothetical protein